MKKVKYSDIRDSLNTFDLILFSGRGFVSSVIKVCSRSKFSHVGVVIKKEDIRFRDAEFRDGGVILFESTILGNNRDIFFNEHKRGVQFVYFSDKIKNYKGNVYIRQIKIKEEDKEGMILKLNEFALEVENREYERSKLELLFSCIPFLKLHENLNTLFCSELVAELYQRIGLLPDYIQSNSYTPNSFSKDLPLEFGKLKDIIQISI